MSQHRSMDLSSPAPLLSARGIAVALATALVLCWPILAVGTPLVYFDTAPYLQSGEAIWTLLERVADAVLPQEAATAPQGPGAAADDGIRQIRSSVYSFFAFATSRLPGGLVVTLVLQTTLTLLTLFALITPETLRDRRRLVVSFVLLGAVTTLPWHAAYAMPDLQAATVVLFYAVLVHRIDAIGAGWRLALTAIATFAVSCHYGYVPLAVGLIVCVLGIRLWQGRTSVLVLAMAVVPVLLTAAINMAGSQVVVGEASVAPKRLPVLLARSLDDGPAYDYLRNACPEIDDLAICTLLDPLPDDITAFLWGDGGIASLSAEELDRIRDEEPTILWRSFRAYPLRQTEALLGNALRQTVSVGTGELFPALGLDLAADPPFQVSKETRGAYGALHLFDPIVAGSTLLGFALAAWLALRRRCTGPELAVLAVCLLGILGNALIFGGLSAPVDRYQSRLVWIVPAVALLIWTRNGGRVRARAT